MTKLTSLASATLLVLASPAILAAEQALATTFEAADLKWGPCPEFLPKGCQIAVLHGDPAQQNADIFLKVPGKSSLADHWHTSAERMVLVSGELHVTYEGQPMTTLKVGSYAYGPAKLRHKAECVSKAPCVLFIAFESPVDAVPSDQR
jgi:quercetin dioxygenase-like cupin family protein